MLFHSTVISAAERESAYVIDGLMHNDVVKSDVHSTDTHGYKVAGKTLHLGYFSRKSEEDLCSSCGQGCARSLINTLSRKPSVSGSI